MAPANCHDGIDDQKGPLARVMKMSQFSVREISKNNDFISDTKVLNDTTTWLGKHGSKGDPGTNSKDNTEKDGHTP